MSSYTLLDYVQTILSSLDSDEVNSYDDTVESLQVAHIVKTVYNDIQSRVDLPEHYTLFELNASGSSQRPVLMTRPSDVSSIIEIRYNCALADGIPDWKVIRFLPLNEFLDYTYSLIDTSGSGAISEMPLAIGSDTLSFHYKTNVGPTYYTTFDDATLIFDAYNSDVDSTLQKSKTSCYGKKDQTFTLSNSFVPFLDRDVSTLLLNEAKILAFSELKQVGHEVAAKWAQRGWTKVQQNKRGIDNIRSELSRLPNYGK